MRDLSFKRGLGGLGNVFLVFLSVFLCSWGRAQLIVILSGS